MVAYRESKQNLDNMIFMTIYRLFNMAAKSLFVSSAKYYGLYSRRELLKCPRRCAVLRHYKISSKQGHKKKISTLNFSFSTWLEKFGLYYPVDKEKAVYQPIVCAAKPDPLRVYDNGGEKLNKNFVANVVEKVAETVVYIEIKDTRRYYVFTGAPNTSSDGSGFIVRHDGLILTNAHVVIKKPHNEIQVKLHDGSTYIGTIEHLDTNSDLATVRIPCKNLPVMELGKSRNVRPGEFVVAVGSPLSLFNTITFGVVSSASRPSTEIGLEGNHIDYIQTDALITFGNSGGPLVNLYSEAIGISSMMVTRGISFAIPIDYAKDFLVNHVQTDKSQEDQGMKKETEFYLGVSTSTLTPQLILSLKSIDMPHLPSLIHGVFIYKVVENSPAHAGGIKLGDIITHINKKPIFHRDDVYAAMEAGKAIKMTIIRGMRQFEVTVYPETV